MMKRISDLLYIIMLLPLLLATGCANMGTPTGGPRDEDPPRFLSANPAPGAVGVERNKIVLTFDELVNVKDAFNKVVVSPTSQSTPRVSSSGRRVTIEFDSLAPATTYTVDFADAIEDNNEGNKLKNFAYTFSTGAVLDTLRISGRVLSARALEPQQGILVGVHSNPEDSAFTKLPLLRVARTDDRGRFTIRGLAPGRYRVFALGDNDNDFRYSSPEEDIAFFDTTVEPYTEQTSATDSIYDPRTGKLDTVVTRDRTLFLPNDIVLRSFNSELRQQYMTKYERIDSTRIFLRFNTRSSELPGVSILGRPQYKTPGLLEANATLDSIVWWLPPELVKVDSLQLAVAYDRSDADLVVTPVVDTLDFYTTRIKVKPRKSNKRNAAAARNDSIAAITFKFNPGNNTVHDVQLPLPLEVPVPLARFDTAVVRLSLLKDSIYHPAPQPLKVLVPDSLQPRKFLVDYPWDYGASYRLEIDSLAAIDLYGKTSLPLSYDFKIKAADDYCSVLFSLRGLEGLPAFVELLSGNDELVRTAIVENNEAYFPFLTPGRYYARVVLDDNANGLYDTGNYQLGLAPELAYYYPKPINIKKKWDQQVDWDVFAVPIDLMKPNAVLKNKPTTTTKGSTGKKNKKGTVDEEEEDTFDPTRNPFDPNDKGQRNRLR